MFFLLHCDVSVTKLGRKLVMAVSNNRRDVTVISGWVTSVRFSIRIQRILREPVQCGNWLRATGAITALIVLIYDEIQKSHIIKMWSYNRCKESELSEVTSRTKCFPPTRKAVVACVVKGKAKCGDSFTDLYAKANSYLYSIKSLTDSHITP